MSDHRLIVEYKNKQPLELITLTTSLAALADQFKRFVAEEGGVDPEARLFVHEIRPGSVVAELVELGKAANDLWEARDYIAPFVPSLASMVSSILHLKPDAKLLDRPTIKNIANLVAPISIDNGSQLNVIDNRNGTVTNNFFVDPTQAAAIQYNAHHLLNSQLPDEQRFENEPMVLFQMRDAPPGKSGDYGTIDLFSSKHQKLIFAGDDVKEQILHNSGHPFEMVFWVNGVVKTAGGKVVAYRIHELVDATPREG